MSRRTRRGWRGACALSHDSNQQQARADERAECDLRSLANASREREHELFNLQRFAASHEKLASLSTLAAGAAHELGTPLATIALVAKELEHGLAGGTVAIDLIPDARLIREEVERCREILQQMAARAGAGAGEMLVRISMGGAGS